MIENEMAKFGEAGPAAVQLLLVAELGEPLFVLVESWRCRPRLVPPSGPESTGVDGRSVPPP